MAVVITYVDMFAEKFYITHWNALVYVYSHKYDNSLKYIVAFDTLKCSYVITKKYFLKLIHICQVFKKFWICHMIDMYINHAGCVILQVKLWILEKKLTKTSFISIIMVIIIFGPKKNQILYNNLNMWLHSTGTLRKEK